MFHDPPDCSREGFLRLLDQVVDRLSSAPPFLGGSIPCPSVQGDPPARITGWPRLAVQLRGPQSYAISVFGKRTLVRMSPMRGIYWATDSWAVDYPSRGEGFGIVLLPQTLRFIQVRGSGLQPTSPTPWFYHTAKPLGGAAVMVARALDSLAEEGDEQAVRRDLFVILLRLARQHLRDDSPSRHSRDRSHGTWWGVQMFIDENFSPDMCRESVAAAMNLHPNYLSRLARRVAGRSFREVLEATRMQHAKRLLRLTDQKLDRIAGLCGYSDATNFSRAFHRAAGTTPGRFRKPIGIRPPHAH